MSTELLIAAGTVLVLYAALVLVLIVAGRRSHAVALMRFIPDCVVLLKRLIGDERVPRRSKIVLGALVGYLLLPIDLVPDFIPVAGQLDDVLVAALALRASLRSSGTDLIAELWPGPPESLDLVIRAAGGKRLGRETRAQRE